MSKKVLVTGACGFIGSHLMDRFRPDAIGTFLNPTVIDVNLQYCTRCDVREFFSVKEVIKKYTPKYIYHMAAQSFPVMGQKIPKETIEVNVMGTINIFEAIIKVREDIPDYDPIVVVACSSAEYGNAISKIPIPEDNALQPVHVYGVSKVVQDMLAYQYWLNNKIKVIRARIFNTTGPRKQGDLVSDLVTRMVRAKKNNEKIVLVGNRETKRAFLDVSDLCDALELLATKGTYGESYNISAKNVYTADFVLGWIASEIDYFPEVESAEVLKRANDEAIIIGDSIKIRSLGWQPKKKIGNTIKDMIDYERTRCR